ncbi:hypothetical protein [Robiginitalea sp. SC105]|uniref:DoxX family protein n=1 Tax=Robiginitalea sp. SC105 TaxID=2762332 RepID=UPI00163985A8|nr:hypothetical protein [Robiginitalea sp. SC105]MBC2838633.1 hypothetical protein [Robiginitalea sp. SC105]
MIPLATLISVFLLAFLIAKVFKLRLSARGAGRIAMAAMLVFTAYVHFVYTKGMALMIPDFLPYREAGVLATGILELVFIIGLLLPRTYKVTGIALIIYLILVIPAHVHAAIEHIDFRTAEATGHGLEFLWFRIPLQFFFIAWVYWSCRKK